MTEMDRILQELRAARDRVIRELRAAQREWEAFDAKHPWRSWDGKIEYLRGSEQEELARVQEALNKAEAALEELRKALRGL